MKRLQVFCMVARVLQALIVNNQEAIPLQYKTGIFIDESNENHSRSQLHKVGNMLALRLDRMAGARSLLCHDSEIRSDTVLSVAINLIQVDCGFS